MAGKMKAAKILKITFGLGEVAYFSQPYLIKNGGEQPIVGTLIGTDDYLVKAIHPTIIGIGDKHTKQMVSKPLQTLSWVSEVPKPAQAGETSSKSFMDDIKK